ncbi:MAG: transglycosylase SLT domain-containing protein [Kofleriaceae bacterium]
MRVAAMIVVLFACSGDNGHQPTTLPKPEDSGAAAAPAAPLPPPVPTGDPAPFSEAMAAPYFQSGDARVGSNYFAGRNYKLAKVAFERARKAATGDDVARIELMLGLCDEEIGAWSSAAGHFATARAGLPLLGDFIGFHLARALYSSHKPALEVARSVDRASIVGWEAEMLIGDILTAEANWPAIRDHFADYLARRPRGPKRSEARFRLAEALEQTKGEPAQIVQLYRLIRIDDPLSGWSARAASKLAALAKTVPPDVAKTVDKLTAAEHIARGMELFDAMRNPESEAAFAAALADPAISPADKCIAAYHRAQSRFKARDRKGASALFDDATAACKPAGNTDLLIKSLYQAGRSYAFIGEHTVAIQKYQAAQIVDPKHSYSDDALLREAEEWESLNDGAKVEAVLSSLPIKFPEGDNVAEAMWRLGWRNWREQKYDAAIKWWAKQIELVPHDDNYYGEGQAQYWLGRAYAATGKPKEALASWEAGVRKYPLAYYALLGLNRIREAAPDAYKVLVAELSTPPKDFDPKAPAFSFAPRPDWGTPGFLRAMELLRLGLSDPAALELKKVGLTAPPGKKRVDDPDMIEKLWAMAYLYDRAGRYATSLWPTRWHILDYRRAWPIGANRARWLIAYPKGYWDLLSRHAKRNNVPMAMQIGIVREESGFNPSTESYANAMGLTQMIPPTAKDFAKGTGITPSRSNMFDPETNVTIGSRFLASLFTRFKRFTHLVPTGYNAGPGFVRRGLKLRGTWDADEFVEGIVDDQARNYTKRVLSSYFTYSWLYENATVPEMPNKIPPELIPKP